MLLLIYLFSFHFQNFGSVLNQYLVQTISKLDFLVIALDIPISHLLA